MKTKSQSKITLVLLLVLSMVLGSAILTFAASSDVPAAWDGIAATGFAGGAGTENDPYIIKTAGQLAYMRDQINAGAAGFSSAHYRLDADIALNDISNAANWASSAPVNTWEAIGNKKENAFTGTFDGNGHTIYGLYNKQLANGGGHGTYFYDGSEDTSVATAPLLSPYVGLFGRIHSATIKDVVLSDGYMQGLVLAGGLVAFANNSHISGIVNKSVNVKTDKDQYVKFNDIPCEAGGIVAELRGASIVSDCVNSAYIQGKNGSGSSGTNLFARAGGIVGRIENSSDVGCYVYNCVNYGQVYGRGQHGHNGHAFVGGIVGEARYATVSSCINDSDLVHAATGTGANANSVAGGIVGMLYAGSVKSCMNLGDLVKAGPDTSSGAQGTIRAAGIVGHSEGAKVQVNGTWVTFHGKVQNNISISKIENLPSANVAANANIAAVAGYVGNYSKIQHNYFVVVDGNDKVFLTQKTSDVTIADNYAITAEHLKGTSSAIIGAESEYANTANLVLALDRFIKADNKSYTMTFDQGENNPVFYREYKECYAVNFTGTELGSYSTMATADGVFPPATGLAADGAVVGETFRFSVTPNAGYILRNVEMTVGNGAPVVLAPDMEGGYSFVMPTDALVIALNFVPEGAGAHTITYAGVEEAIAWSGYRPQAHFEGYTTSIPVPTRSNYLFAGWVVNGQGAPVVNLVLGANDYTSAITLTATWTPKKVVDINYGQQIPVYNGEAKPFAIEGADAALAGLKVEYLVGGEWTENAPALAGKYNVRLTRAEDDVYQSLNRVLEEALFIDRAASSVTIHGNLDKVYDGAALVLPEVSTVGDGNVSYHWFQGENELSAAPVNAGAYKLVVRISQGANYKAAEAELAINVARATIPADSFSWNYTTPYEYNGSVQSVTVVGLPSHVVVTYGGVASAENAGEYTATATLAVDETNYNPISIAPIDWKIEKATINASDMHWNYDGVYYYNATVHSVAIVGIPANVEVSYSGVVNAKDVGVYSVSATFTFDDQNYNPISIEPLTWEIKKATLASLGLTWSVADFTYDGNLKSVYVVGLPADITISGYVGNEGTLAGSYTASATFSYDTNNYEEVSIAPFTWEIKKATYNVEDLKWTENLSFVYDGQNKVVGVSGVPAGVVVNYVDNEKANAGTYKAIASFTVDPNYNEIPAMEIEWNIAKADAVISAEAEYLFYYNGGAIVIPAILNHSEVAITTNPAEIIEKGEYTVELIAAESANYNATSITVKVVVVESDASILNRIAIMIDQGIYTESQAQRLALIQKAYAAFSEVRDLTAPAAREALDNFGYLVYVYNDYAEHVNNTMAQAEEAALVMSEAYVYSPAIVATLSDIKKKKFFD